MRRCCSYLLQRSAPVGYSCAGYDVNGSGDANLLGELWGAYLEAQKKCARNAANSADENANITNNHSNDNVEYLTNEYDAKEQLQKRLQDKRQVEGALRTATGGAPDVWGAARGIESEQLCRDIEDYKLNIELEVAFNDEIQSEIDELRRKCVVFDSSAVPSAESATISRLRSQIAELKTAHADATARLEVSRAELERLRAEATEKQRK